MSTLGHQGWTSTLDMDGRAHKDNRDGQVLFRTIGRDECNFEPLNSAENLQILKFKLKDSVFRNAWEKNKEETMSCG